MLPFYPSAPQVSASDPVRFNPGISRSALVPPTWEPLRQDGYPWAAPIVLTSRKSVEVSARAADVAVSSDPEKAALHRRHKPWRKRKPRAVDLLNPPSAAAERERAISLMRARGSVPVVGSVCTMHGLTAAGYVVIDRGLDALLPGHLPPRAWLRRLAGELP